jgi:hypothetical protein
MRPSRKRQRIRVGASDEGWAYASKLKVSTFRTLDGLMQAPDDASEFERGD